MELKDSLRQLREQHHWKQTELARILGIKRSTYTYYETGKTEPPLSRLLLLSKIYNVSLDTLVGRDQEDGEGPAQARMLDAGPLGRIRPPCAVSAHMAAILPHIMPIFFT